LTIINPLLTRSGKLLPPSYLRNADVTTICDKYLINCAISVEPGASGSACSPVFHPGLPCIITPVAARYRCYNRALGGQPANQSVPLHNGANATLLAALYCHGLVAAMTVDGAVNRAVFAAYLDQVLRPTLQPGDVAVLDNLPVHKTAGLAELVEKRGARLLFLPPYSPDFNPIKVAFSKLKT
jgi:hypothetical protein